MNTVSDWESEGGAVADEEVIAKWRKHAQDIRSRNFVGRDAGMVQSTIAAASTPYNNANSYIGVGDSTTAFAVGQTDLQAATNKLRKAMDATYPQGGSNVITWRSTFATADANYAWQEWGVFNASSAGTMLNRKVESLGTKTSAQTWQFTVTLTFTTA